MEVGVHNGHKSTYFSSCLSSELLTRFYARIYGDWWYMTVYLALATRQYAEGNMPAWRRWHHRWMRWRDHTSGFNGRTCVIHIGRNIGMVVWSNGGSKWCLAAKQSDHYSIPCFWRWRVHGCQWDDFYHKIAKAYFAYKKTYTAIHTLVLSGAVPNLEEQAIQGYLQCLWLISKHQQLVQWMMDHAKQAT